MYKVEDFYEEGWETVIDFTEISADGVPVEDVLKALERLSRLEC